MNKRGIIMFVMVNWSEEAVGPIHQNESYSRENSFPVEELDTILDTSVRVFVLCWGLPSAGQSLL